MRRVRRDVDPVPGDERRNGSVRRERHRTFEDDAYLLRVMRVRRVMRVGVIAPLRNGEAFILEHCYPVHCRYDSRVPRPPLEPLLAAPQKALKEWAVVCDALASGQQSVLLRKGGIIEETRDFQLVEQRFLMYPTYEHQNLDSVQAPYREGFQTTLANKPSDDIVRIDAWAEVTDLFLTHDLDALLELADLYAWSEDYIRMRMAYKPRKPMNVVIVRAHRLPKTVDVPVEEHFAGCKSWVPLAEAVPLDGSVHALAEDEHDLRVKRVATVLAQEPVLHHHR